MLLPDLAATLATYLSVGRKGHGDDGSDSEELEEGVHGDSSLFLDQILEK